jgi:hypothetical protein
MKEQKKNKLDDENSALVIGPCAPRTQALASVAPPLQMSPPRRQPVKGAA